MCVVPFFVNTLQITYNVLPTSRQGQGQAQRGHAFLSHRFLAAIQTAVGPLMIVTIAVRLAVAPGVPAADPDKFIALHALAYAFVTVCFLSARFIASTEMSEPKRANSSLPVSSLTGSPSITDRVALSRVLWCAGWVCLVGFAAIRIGFASAPYSPMWRTTCQEFDFAETHRLSALDNAQSLRSGRRFSPVGGGARSAFSANSADPPAVIGGGPLCVAIATTPRDGGRYLTQSVSTLVKGLAGQRPEEGLAVSRLLSGSVFIVTSRNHTEAEEVGQRFAQAVQVQRVSVPEEPAAMLNGGKPETWRETWDYVRTLEACLGTNASYALVLEDDVISGPELIEKTLDEVRQLEEIRAGKWLSLRLWETDKFGGWAVDSDRVAELLGMVALGGFVSAAMVGLLAGIRSAPLWFVVWLLFSANVLILCEAIGRQYVVPSFSMGLSLDFQKGARGRAGEPNGAAGFTTTVGQVYPLDNRTHDLIDYMKSRVGTMQTDNLIRQYLIDGPDVWGELDESMPALEQWMLWPPLVQHIGRHSSVGHNSSAWSCQGFPMATAFLGLDDTVVG